MGLQEMMWRASRKNWDVLTRYSWEENGWMEYHFHFKSISKKLSVAERIGFIVKHTWCDPSSSFVGKYKGHRTGWGTTCSDRFVCFVTFSISRTNRTLNSFGSHIGSRMMIKIFSRFFLSHILLQSSCKLTSSSLFFPLANGNEIVPFHVAPSSSFPSCLNFVVNITEIRKPISSFVKRTASESCSNAIVEQTYN